METPHLRLSLDVEKNRATLEGQSFQFDHLVLRIENNTFRNDRISIVVVNLAATIAKLRDAGADEIEGEVLVAFDVLEDGRVANPKIIKGPEEFHEAVLQIALTWRYQPATLGGKPVKGRATKLVVFKLDD